MKKESISNINNDVIEGSHKHVLVVPYPSQGHVNPMLQLCKRLAFKGTKTTLAITSFISKTMPLPEYDGIGIATFSDGCDEAGFVQAKSVADYLFRLETSGRKTLTELMQKHNDKQNTVKSSPISCVVYDAFLPWVLDLAKEFRVLGAAFFTQACTVNLIYYYVHHGLFKIPVAAASSPVEIPGLPEAATPFGLADMPSFICEYGTYPAYFEMVLNQFSNLDKADFVLVNSFYKLEDKVVDTMSKLSPLLTIGPTIPSFYLDNRVENDTDYSLNLFPLDSTCSIDDWLNSKPIGSVIYVSFGSMGILPRRQMEEIAFGLKACDHYFLWVVKASEKEKLPENFIQETSEKGLFVTWSPQLRVLSNKAVGCFFSHGGWNSTTEALCMGVPMVIMPLWTDQTTNAKLVQDVWGVGLRVKVDEDGIVGRKEIEKCIKEVMENEKGKEIKRNAIKWKDLAKEAASEGGTSDIDIQTFISKVSI